MINKPKKMEVKNSVLHEIIKEIQQEKRCAFPYWGNWGNWRNWSDWNDWYNWYNWWN